MPTAQRITHRLWQFLRGEPEPYVQRGETGRLNEDLRAAWSSYVADRGLLIVTLVWLLLQFQEWQRIALRPDALYQARFWLADLMFPTPPSSIVFYLLLIAAGGFVLGAFMRPESFPIRIATTISILLVSVPEHGYGHVEHTAHLLLLAHLYSTFRPIERPGITSNVETLSRGYSWFLLGLLAVYTASGLWKVVDITIRDVIKPGVTWLEPEAMLATSIAAMRNVDLSFEVPQIVASVAWAFPIGYILLTLIFVASFVAAFRRPLLLIVVPTVVSFHLLNAIVMYVLFIYTIVMVVATLTPYDFAFPWIRRRLVGVTSTRFYGKGHAAMFEIRYRNGDADYFQSFYAYRENLRQSSALFAAPLYYPGLGLMATWILEKLERSP